MSFSRSFFFLTVLLALLAGCVEVVPEPGVVPALNPGETAKALVVTRDMGIETAHPYSNHTDQSWEIRAPASATSLTVYFDRLDTEQGYDFVYLYDGDDNLVHRLSGRPADLTYTVAGDFVRLRFGSDYSITGWGFAMSRYSYETDEPDHPTDHRPYCGAIGSRSEGWYWGDTGELIRYELCADLDEPECSLIGTRSEGWYSNGDPARIEWDSCRHTLRLALVGEPCGGSIGISCFGGAYCHGMPTDDGIRGGTGTCRPYGWCEVDSDCQAEENMWVHPLCYGLNISCGGDSLCTWRCDPIRPGPWSWSTVLLRDIESPHPYGNNYDNTWDVVQSGAEKIQVHFSQIETETGYDRIVLSGDREESAVMIEGSHEDYWSPEFNGDTVHINLETDYSVTKYGFRADLVRYYEQLPYGICNRTEDCQAGYVCEPHLCINPYAPCHGECRHDDSCDDGSTPLCEMIPPVCPEGTIMAFRGNCYTCVDPDTCEPPVVSGGGEGDPCDGSRTCDDGLFCKAIVDGVGECRDELWCDDATVEADCRNVIHIAVPGVWACQEQRCAWQTGMTGGTFINGDAIEIPDADTTGIESGIQVNGLIESCAYDVTVDVSITHTYRGDLVVGLTDPDGTRELLHVREGWSADDLILENAPAPNLGRDGVIGTWILDVSDHARWDVGQLESWGLELRCR